MNKESKSSGMGLGSVLFVVFLVLKLTDHIDWSWWWVTSPLWIQGLIVIVFFYLLGVYQRIHDRKQERKHLEYMKKFPKIFKKKKVTKV